MGIVTKAGVGFTLVLRGSIVAETSYANRAASPYAATEAIYLLKDSIVGLSSNEVKAIAYCPANRVYVGGTDGFRNLSYTMPQLMNIAYGVCRVDHDDTNHTMYSVFAAAERLAQHRRYGYWKTHRPGETP